MIVEITVKVPAEVVPEIRNLAEKLAKMHVAGSDEAELPLERLDWCVAQAINELIKDRVIRSSRDYAWILSVMNEQVIDDFEEYNTPISFIDYLKMLKIEKLPSKSVLYDNCALVENTFPDWDFSDCPNSSETVRFHEGKTRRFGRIFGKVRVSRKDFRKREKKSFEGSERCSTFALSKGRKPRRQEIFDLLEQRTHSEGREGENEHEFHK